MTRTGSPRDAWKNTARYRCPKCKSIQLFKDGFVRGVQRFRCKKCDTVTILPIGMQRRSRAGKR